MTSGSTSQGNSRAKPLGPYRQSGSTLASFLVWATAETRDNRAWSDRVEGLNAVIPPSCLAQYSVSDFSAQHEELREDTERFLRVAAEEPYRDGMEGRPQAALRRFLAKGSVAAVHVLGSRILPRWANRGVAADVARLLGRVHDPTSVDERRHVVERLLHSESPLVRDSAAVALADMEDRRGIRPLEEAIEREPLSSLKDDMELALGHLRDYGVSAPEG